MTFCLEISLPEVSINSLATDGIFDASQGFESAVMDACQILDDAGCEFTISGFGSERWPVSVRADLSTFVEQVPLLIEGLVGGCTQEVDLYEQGIERNLKFAKISNGDVEIRCASRTSWTPNPEVEVVEFDRLMRMLNRLLASFVEGLRICGIDVTDIPPFSQWVSA